MLAFPFTIEMPDICHELTRIFAKSISTLIERKSRIPQIQGIKGDAVVAYREPLITQEMGIIGFPAVVNKMKPKIDKFHLFGSRNRIHLSSMTIGIIIRKLFNRFILFTLILGSNYWKSPALNHFVDLWSSVSLRGALILR